MKRFLTLALMAFVVLYALTGCGCDDGKDVDLVFVNDSDTVIMAVLADFADQTSGMQNADSSPLKRGETFGFEAGEYPVTVAVYDKTNGNLSGPPLARLTIDRAPPEGERWYVVARDGGRGLALSAGIEWPDGV